MNHAGIKKNVIVPQNQTIYNNLPQKLSMTTGVVCGVLKTHLFVNDLLNMTSTFKVEWDKSIKDEIRIQTFRDKVYFVNKT